MRVSKPAFLAIAISALSYFTLLILYNSSSSCNETSVYLLSLLGWILWLYVLFTWKNATGELFSMYTIFISFLILFSYGQCLMWALGIHIPTEIGKYTNIPKVGISSIESIYNMQLLTLSSISFFHCGALLSYRSKPLLKDNEDNEIEEATDKADKTTLRSICYITFAISSIATYIIWMGNMIINRTYGYGAYLYDAEATASRSNILTLLSWMFVPSIIGLLISTDYSRPIRRIGYGVFIGYAVICTLAGYRSWIYELVILLWLHNKSYMRIRKKNLLLGGLLMVGVLVLATSLKNARQVGLTWGAIREAMVGVDNPIVAAFFEMGGSMNIGTIILSRPNFDYPYGNTYLLAIPGMITDRIIQFFVPEYVSIGGWFSQVYLGLIGRGVGFSMIAESIVNYGVFGTPIWMLVMGLLMTRFIFSERMENSVLNRFFSISTCLMLLPIARNTFLSTMKRWTFSTLSIAILFLLISNFRRSREK